VTFGWITRNTSQDFVNRDMTARIDAKLLPLAARLAGLQTATLSRARALRVRPPVSATVGEAHAAVDAAGPTVGVTLAISCGRTRNLHAVPRRGGTIEALTIGDPARSGAEATICCGESLAGAYMADKLRSTRSATGSKPRSRPSDETSADQLRLARSQDRALRAAVRQMNEREAHGREVRAGHYLVGVAAENVEGLCELRDGGSYGVSPEEENGHLEVSVRDTEDGRFVPGLDVRVRVRTRDRRELGIHRHASLWHPWLYHYRRNWSLPGDGTYTIIVHIAVPDFPRHDKINGHRYAERVDVEFAGFEVRTGQKRSRAAAPIATA
jgi:hypothetical protein